MNDQPDMSQSLNSFNTLEDLLDPEVVAGLSTTHDLRATGFTPLDTMFAGGLARGELLVIGGRPGVGKSVALMQWARNLALDSRSVVIATYEHSELVVLSQFLLIELGELVATPTESTAARGIVDSLISGKLTWADAMSQDSTLALAAKQMAAYSGNIRVLDSRGRDHGLDVLKREVMLYSTDVLIIDHLQKIEAGAVGLVKRLAVTSDITVIATSTTTDDGIAQSRIRSTSLVDAASVAHEADILVMLNNKISIVSRNHSAFDSVRAASFHNQVVFTLEKNRRGPAPIEIEFDRDFPHRRFNPRGAFVTERLVDKVTVME